MEEGGGEREKKSRKKLDLTSKSGSDPAPVSQYFFASTPPAASPSGTGSGGKNVSARDANADRCAGANIATLARVQ